MKNKTTLTLAGLALCAALSACNRGGDNKNSSININGSDTMLQVGLAWAEAYKSVKPDVAVAVNGEGSGTGIKALINGTVDMAHSSRAIKESEAASIKEKHGKAPVEHIVGFDGIAVFVHKDNPVKSLSLPQLKAIWGEGGSIENWKDVGGPDATIERFGRSNSSGTHAFYKKAVLGKGVEFKLGTASSAGSTAVVDTCATTLTAIGYSGMSYKTDAVGWLAISKADGEEAFEPSIPNVASGKYPIARPLYIYTVGEPSGHVKEYIDWVKSGGQASLEEQGFVPLSVE
jgi:phosphate transport system substrate-binding protein